MHVSLGMVSLFHFCRTVRETRSEPVIRVTGAFPYLPSGQTEVKRGSTHPLPCPAPGGVSGLSGVMILVCLSAGSVLIICWAAFSLPL